VIRSQCRQTAPPIFRGPLVKIQPPQPSQDASLLGRRPEADSESPAANAWRISSTGSALSCDAVETLMAGRASKKRSMRSAGSSALNLSIAILAAVTVCLPNRAAVCGRPALHLASRQSIVTQTSFKPSPTRGPARTPVCHLRCREFVANVPDVPQQPHAATLSGPEIHSACPVAVSAVAACPAVVSPPDTSPPTSEVLRL
jgi:hypothetical protein